MKKLVVLLFFFSPAITFACMCSQYHRDMNRAIKEYSFIAHVKIIKKSLPEKSDTSLVKQYFDPGSIRKVEIEIIELYKGTNRTLIAEWGVGTSCDMGIRENEEWVLFGNYIDDKYASVSYCNVWIKLANAEGERHWMYDSGIEAMQELRKLANIPQREIKDGKLVSYFQNGNMQAEEEYRNGLLNGYRKIYYSNGRLMKEGLFEKGKPSGSHKEYARHGQLISEFYYEKEHITHSVWWYDTSYSERRLDAIFLSPTDGNDNMPPPLIQKYTEGWFDTLSGNRYSVVYSRMGQVTKENYSFSHEVSKLTCEYFGSGRLKSENHYFKNGEVSVQKIWDENGNLLSEKRWLNNKIVFKSN